jgi:two-component sensor histidine kinase
VLGHSLDATPIVDNTAVVVSELVTNAVNAHCSGVVVDVAVHRRHIRISVADDCPDPPELQDPTTRDEHGRGLRIVDALARAWGVLPSRLSKKVWAVIPVPAKLTREIPCTVASLV